MGVFVTTVEQLFALLVVVGIGLALRTFNVFSPDFAYHLNRLVFYIIIPAMLFDAGLKVNTRSWNDLSASAGYALAVIAAIAVLIPLASRFPAERRGALIQASYRSNLAYIGIPVLAAMFGDQTLPTMALIVSTGVVVHTVASIVLLRVFSPPAERDGRGTIMRMIATSPILWSVAIGVVVGFIGLQVPVAISGPVGLLRQMGLPAVLILVGLRMDLSAISNRLRELTVVVLFKLLVMPMSAYGIARLFLGITDDRLIWLTIAAGMPTAAMSQSFAGALSADESLTAGAISTTTLLLVVSVPLIRAVLEAL